ncbi:MAG: hypothetical protein ACLGHL_04300 [Actinomycetota bacterium]
MLATAVVLAALGAIISLVATRARLAHPPPALVRVNVRGRRVPAVLGEGLILGGAIGLAWLAIATAAGWGTGTSFRMIGAVGILIATMGAAGSWDDHRGDEKPRGFAGHLGALRSGKVTGGLVKLMVGGVAGLIAGAILTSSDPAETLRAGVTIALAANLINLLDRAPGRALKAVGILWLPLLWAAWGAWAICGAPLLGAAAGAARDDLGERGMLGDAGANPLGATLGLGLFVASDAAVGWAIVLVLAGLNLASERWSFSAIIEGNPLLKRLDSAGRETS